MKHQDDRQEAADGEGRILANKAFLLVVSKLLAMGFNIALFVVLSYSFSREDYGEFRQVWLINRALAFEICTLGIPLSVFYFLPRLEEGRRRAFVTQSLALLAGAGILVTAGVFIFADTIAAAFDSPGLASLLRLFCLFPLLTLPTLVAEGVLLTLDYARSFAILTILERVLMFAAVLLALLFSRTIESVLVAILVFTAARFVACAVLVRISLRQYKKEAGSVSVKEQLRFSLPINFSNIVDVLAVELDKLVITLYFSVAQFARYANGAFDIPLIAPVAQAINSVMMPEFARAHQAGRTADVVRHWNSAILRVALMFVPLMGYLFFFATEFITLAFSSKYADSAIIFQIYLFAMLPKMVWYGPLFVALGHSKEPMIGALMALAANLGLNLLFIEWIGFTGPAVATVLTAFLLTIYFMLRLRSILGIRLADVFPWRSVGLLTVISIAGAAAASYLLGALPVSEVARLLLGGIVSLLLIAPLLWKTKLLLPSDIAYLLERASKVKRFLPSRKA